MMESNVWFYVLVHEQVIKRSVSIKEDPFSYGIPILYALILFLSFNYLLSEERVIWMSWLRIGEGGILDQKQRRNPLWRMDKEAQLASMRVPSSLSKRFDIVNNTDHLPSSPHGECFKLWYISPPLPCKIDHPYAPPFLFYPSTWHTPCVALHDCEGKVVGKKSGIASSSRPYISWSREVQNSCLRIANHIAETWWWTI